MKVIFLESPTKSKTFNYILKNNLNEEFVVYATNGHLEKLKDSGMFNIGVNFSSNYEPEFVIRKERIKLINKWKKFLLSNSKNIEKIYLATDSDREGERISQSIKDCLNLPQFDYDRLLINEITQVGILNSLNKPTKINDNLVFAQISRQVADKIIGYRLSPIVKEILGAKSVGRIQSFVLKLIVERYLLLENKKNYKEYIICSDLFLKEDLKIVLKYVDEKNKLIVYENSTTAENDKVGIDYEISFSNKNEKELWLSPRSPLTTSLLLSEAKNKLNFSIEQTTKISQKLYEGIFLNIENKREMVGLISYPRTDSIRINDSFSSKIEELIKKEYGKNYFNFFPHWKQLKENSQKEKNVQDAHEAIRPTHLEYHPDYLREFLTEDEYKLYKLIFFHTIESFMVSSKYKKKEYIFVDKKGRRFLFVEKVIVFDGYFIIRLEENLDRYCIKKKETICFDLSRKFFLEKIYVKEYLGNKIYPYDESDIIKKLETLGIGRPSTYKSFSEILLTRNYVIIKGKRFYPTPLGIKLYHWVEKNLSSIINEKYTSLLEEELDDISSGKITYEIFIHKFWTDLTSKIETFYKDKSLL